MAENLRALRQQIRSVQSTQKITKAMQMVAGAKLRRMQGELISFRPFAERLEGMLDRFLTAYPGWEHPYLTSVMVSQSNHDRSSFDELRTNEGPPLGVLVVTSDTGLCGTYNERVLERTERFFSENPSARIVSIGKKGNRFFSRRGIRRAKEILDWGGRYEQSRAFPLFDWLTERFSAGEVSGWAVVYTQFISALQWKPVVATLLPLIPADSARNPSDALPEKLIVEPDAARLGEELLQRAARARFARILLEAFTAEHSARMLAMKNATENATEMMDHLTLVRNKARQAAITKELLEVVSGAEALK